MDGIVLTLEEKKKVEEICLSYAIRPDVKKVRHVFVGRDKNGIPRVDVFVILEHKGPIRITFELVK